MIVANKSVKRFKFPSRLGKFGRMRNPVEREAWPSVPIGSHPIDSHPIFCIFFSFFFATAGYVLPTPHLSLPIMEQTTRQTIDVAFHVPVI